MESVNAKEAVENRIIELCEKKGVAINALANISGVPPSSIYSMLNTKSNNPGVVSIKKICDGFEITLRDFFDSELFDHLEAEVQKKNSNSALKQRAACLLNETG